MAPILTRSNDRADRAGSTFSFDSNAFDQLQPLKSMADRVSDQVEAFAESVDRWSTQLRDLSRSNKSAKEQTKGQHTLSLQLLQELQGVVRRKSDNLQKRHTGGAALSRTWRKRIGNVTENESTGGSLLSEDLIGNAVNPLHQAQGEQSTFELLDLLISIRFPDPSTNIAQMKREFLARRGDVNAHTSGSELWERFLLQDDEAREKSLVLKWLETAVVRNDPKFDDIVDHIQERAGQDAGTWSRGWMNTRERIKAAKRFQSTSGPKSPQELDIMNTEKTAQLAVQLDPDVVQRQGRSLEKADERYEASLWLVCFTMLRRGMKWVEIRDWFDERNESWRTLSLGMGSEEQQSRTFAEGPYAGALWRRMCFANARRGSSDPYERAVYGLLAGDIDSVEPVSSSWDDHLYVHYNAALITAFEEFLVQSKSGKLPNSMATRFPSAAVLGVLSDPRQIVEKLGQQRTTLTESRQPLKIIQGALLAGTFDDLVYQLGIAVSKKVNADITHASAPTLIPRTDEPCVDTFSSWIEDFEMIGLVVHVWAIWQFYTAPELSNEARELTENVVIYYMDYLRKLGKVECIPTYSTFIEANRRADILGVIMTDITDRDEQKLMVELMNKIQIDMPRMLHHQLWYSLERADLTKAKIQLLDSISMLEESELPNWPGQKISKDLRVAALDQDEMRIVQAAEWFMFVASSWSESFEILSLAMRALLATGRWPAALALTKRTPFHDLSMFKSKPYFEHGIDVFSPEDEEQLLAMYAVPETPAPKPPTVEATPGRRTTRASAKAQTEQPTQSREASEAPKAESKEMEIAKSKLRLLRRQSRQFLEMQQLCLLLEQLAAWRKLEEKTPRNFVDSMAPSDYNKMLRLQLDDLELAAAPMLLGNFMAEFGDDVEKSDYEHILRLYIPAALIAYNSALIFASTHLTPDILYTSFTLANTLAAEAPSTYTTQPATLEIAPTEINNSHITRAILSAGLMSDLVTSFACSARMLLQLNQRDESRARQAERAQVELGIEGKRKSKGKRKALKKRGWEGESLEVWDPTRSI